MTLEHITDLNVAITGHRPTKLPGGYDVWSQGREGLRDRLLHELDRIVEDRVPDQITLITGMALGVDQDFAMVGQTYDMPVHAYIPGSAEQQCSLWPNRSKDLYRQILEECAACSFIPANGDHYSRVLQRRNEAMVQDCDLLIGVWDGSSGGTANCLNYARRCGVEVRLMSPNGDGTRL